MFKKRNVVLHDFGLRMVGIPSLTRFRNMRVTGGF